MTESTKSSGPVLENMVLAGTAAQDAVAVNDHIYMSRGVSNAYLVTTSGGDVVINTGLPHEGPAHRERFARVSAGPVKVITLTQGHADHFGGWGVFNGPGVETIVQSNFPEVRGYWNRLDPFYRARSARIWAGIMARSTNAPAAMASPPDPIPTLMFTDHHVFTLGGRRFELLSAPGGETTDSLIVWLPGERTAFSGNMMGPIFGHVPNLYTIRGDKIRSALRFIASVDRLRALEPELLITGHGEPVRGAAHIAAELTKVRNAVQWIHDQTVEGMNAGTDLFTLMREIVLPPELRLGEGHGKVSWCVRAIWEEYAGWFRLESTTELYAVPPRAIWQELAGLAGGAAALAARASAHVAAGRPLEALHFTDIALAADPRHGDALAAKLAALELLLEHSGRSNLSETRWLENEIAAVRAASRTG